MTKVIVTDGLKETVYSGSIELSLQNELDTDLSYIKLNSPKVFNNGDWVEMPTSAVFLTKTAIVSSYETT